MGLFIRDAAKNITELPRHIPKEQLVFYENIPGFSMSSHLKYLDCGIEIELVGLVKPASIIPIDLIAVVLRAKALLLGIQS